MKIKVFSDDAIQRITSVNEPTQTKISLDVLKKVLKPHQMRNVLGGSGDDGNYPLVLCYGKWGMCAFSDCHTCMAHKCAGYPEEYPTNCKE